MIRLPIRRCPDCWYIGPTRRFAAAAEGEDETGDGSEADADGVRYRCPRCGHEVEAPDPRLK